jgi:hypothetical protein
VSTKSAAETAAPDGQQQEPTLAVVSKDRKRKQACWGMSASSKPRPGQREEVLEKKYGS